jgi:apolipoprotein N-acyltransferase
MFSPRVIRLGLAALGGGLAALGHAPFSLPWVALAGLLALFAAVDKAANARAAAWTAWLGGAVYFAVVMHWIVEPFQVDAARHGWMAPFALVFLAGGLALFWALAGWTAGRLGGALSPLVFALALSAVEVVRSVIFTGLPWGLIGGIWIDGSAAAWLSWVGPHGLGLLTLLGPAGVFVMMRRSTVFAAVPFVAVPLVLSATGMLQSPAPIAATGAPVVRLIQPNAPQHLKWDPDWTATFYRRQLEMTAEAGAPALTVWPETAVAMRLPGDAGALAQISQAAGGRQVVLGLNRFENTRVFNAAIALGANGEITARYDKSHLVPFGEYVPLGDIMAGFGIYGLASRDGFGYTAGPGPELMDLGALGMALPLICYEAIFPGFGRTLSHDAAFMLHLTNDAWFGNFAGPQQHLNLARMRARERGLPVVRAANTGVSAMIDARGGIVGSIPLNQTGFLDVALPPRIAPTLYVKWGALPFALLWLCCALAAFARRPRRAD